MDPATKAKSRWNLRLGRVAGIDIRMHATFLLLLVWVAYSDLSAGRGASAAAAGVLLVVCVFATVVLHELAHALMARRFGVRTRDITLLPIGGVSSLERIPDKPRQELLIALAGPSVNLILAAALFGLLALMRAPMIPHSLQLASAPFLGQLAWVNVALAGFNLLPAFPMDGGRVLRAALALRLDYDKATQVAARLGQAVALGFGVIGLFYNPLLIFIALFVWVGAQQEAALVHLRATLSGLPVERAMIRQFLTLSPTDTLSRAMQLVLPGFQSVFPVVDGDRLAGLVTREDVLSGLRSVGPDAPVAAIMRRDVEAVDRGQPVESALSKLGAAGGRAVVVTEHGSVVGLLTAESVAELALLDRGPYAH